MDKLIRADKLLQVLIDDINISGANLARIKRHIEDAPAVDAVMREDYESMRMDRDSWKDAYFECDQILKSVWREKNDG